MRCSCCASENPEGIKFREQRDEPRRWREPRRPRQLVLARRAAMLAGIHNPFTEGFDAAARADARGRSMS